MAAVRHLGFWKFNFLTVWTVKRPILHNLAKFREHRSIRCCDIAIVVIFKKFEILTVVVPGLGLGFIVVPNVIKLGETVAEIWRFNGFFLNGGSPPSWICRAHIGTTH